MDGVDPIDPKVWIMAKKNRVLSIFVCFSFFVAWSFADNGVLNDGGLFKNSFLFIGIPFVCLAWLGGMKAKEYTVSWGHLAFQWGVGVFILLSFLALPFSAV